VIRQPHQTGLGGDIDDSSPLLCHHRTSDLLGQKKSGFQVGVELNIPFVDFGIYRRG
jgi:hypothetical protein